MLNIGGVPAGPRREHRCRDLGLTYGAFDSTTPDWQVSCLMIDGGAWVSSSGRLVVAVIERRTNQTMTRTFAPRILRVLSSSRARLASSSGKRSVSGLMSILAARSRNSLTSLRATLATLLISLSCHR